MSKAEEFCETIYVYDAINDVIDKCRENPYYRCGVYARSIWFLEEAFNSAVNTIHDLNSIKGMVVRKFTRQIIFENGSTIDFRIASENVRGERYNYALVDHMIDNDAVKSVILPCFREYEYVRSSPVREGD